MGFHRLSTPTYYGGLPSGYDYMNDPALSGYGGSPAAADGIKSSGPNEGVYFVAFGESGTSSNVNRGLQALAENTDLLDDIVRGSQVVIRQRTGSGPVSFAVIFDDVWVGSASDSPATVNDQDTRDRIIKVLDDSDNEIEVSGVPVRASLIHDGASNNVVGVTAGGYYTNPTVALNPTIPSGTSFRIYYLSRRNLNDIIENKPSELLLEQIRTAHNVDAVVQSVFKTLHSKSPGPTLAWNDPWDTTIRALAASGLDGRYRRSTAQLATFNFDTAGDGAVISRDGPAPESVLGTGLTFADPINALWIARTGLDRGTGSTPSTLLAGPTGFVSYAGRKTVVGSSTNDDGAVPNASSFLTVLPRDFSANVTNARTQITPSRTATLNPGGSAAAEVQLNASDFAHTGGRSSIAVGYDLMEVTRDSGDVEVYIITSLDPADARTVVLYPLVGHATGGFTIPNEPANVRWISTMFVQGAYIQDYMDVAAANYSSWESFFHAVPPYLTTSPTASTEALGRPASFYANSLQRIDTAPLAPVAIQWGGFNDDASGFTTATYEPRGYMRGDGSLDAVLLSIGSRGSVITSAPGSTTWHPRLDGALLQITATVPVGNAHTLTLNSAYVPQDGDLIEIVIEQDSTLGQMTVTWPSNFLFSGGDAVPKQGTGAVTRYTGVYAGSVASGKFIMTKTAY